MGSPFASLVVFDEIQWPGHAGHWIKVRKLTGRQYEEAQVVHRLGYVGSPDKWAGFFRKVAADPTSEDVQRIIRDPLTGFDRYALAQSGLVAWSHDRPIDADAINDLDDDGVEFIAREVLKRAKPSLFADDQAAQKKSD